jgi:UDP-N-acetylglucosamine transferase subunit ALG13
VIFVTVGAQMPFDRLVEAVDAWAGAHGRKDIFAQIGEGAYVPRHLQWTRFLRPAEFRARYAESELIVAHAGTGSILTALELGKPILVMPRKAALRETRNDHQGATAERFNRLRYVMVAADENDLAQALTRLDASGPAEVIGPYASRVLTESLRAFIEGADVRASLP